MTVRFAIRPGIVRIQPPETLTSGLATKQEQASWNASERMLRTCQHCARAYKNGGFVYRCEHWHEGIE